MTDFVDVKLTNNDISFAANGDFELIDSFDTSLEVSLFADARADVDEVPTPQLRRGWWGNAFLDVEIGSKLWFLDQAINNQQRLAQAENYARLALQWLIVDNFADRVNVTGAQDRDSLSLNISIEKNGSVITERTYDLWRNTL